MLQPSPHEDVQFGMPWQENVQLLLQTPPQRSPRSWHDKLQPLSSPQPRKQSLPPEQSQSAPALHPASDWQDDNIAPMHAAAKTSAAERMRKGPRRRLLGEHADEITGGF
jgi:hypothetical protein